MSLYEDEDLGGPPAVSSWSRGKYDLFLCLTDFQQNKLSRYTYLNYNIFYYQTIQVPN